VGDEEAGGAVRADRSGPARGQATLAVGIALVTAIALVALDRAGPAEPASATPAPAATSGAWICPHGGGDGLSAALFLANPGSTPVSARLTSLGGHNSPAPEALEIPAGETVRVDEPADERGGATYVEYFGGWIGAAWVLTGGGDEPGTAAEPCAGSPARRWYLADATTGLGEDAYVVVANPFASRAVLDAVLYTPDRAPIRDSDWTDLTIPPGRSLALHLNTKVEGEEAVGVELDVSVGRVAAASLGVTDRTRLRSTLGWTGPARSALLPTMGGSGHVQLLVVSTMDRSIRFGATELSEQPPRPAGGLTEQEHAPTSARAYPAALEGGPSAVQLFTLEGTSVVAALRLPGPGEDPASTSGTMVPSPTWVVLPAAAVEPSNPHVVLVNAGDEQVVAHVAFLPRGGGTAAAPVDVSVPAHGAAAVPPAFLDTARGSAILVRADGAIAALAATTSTGKEGLDTFALSMGVAVPQGL
jgi:hypothetical protein